MKILVATLAATQIACMGAGSPLDSKVVGDLPLLPSSLQSRDAVSETCPRGPSPYPRRFMIWWNDTPATDGDFLVVIHPRQMFLRDVHNNPNPNLVYWLIDLSPLQYEGIVDFLDHYRGEVFSKQPSGWWRWGGYGIYQLNHPRISPWFPSQSSDQEEAAWKARVDAIVNANLRRVIDELNGGLPQSVPKLPSGLSVFPSNERPRIAP